MDYQTLASAVQTPQLKDSKIGKYQGASVRAPSMTPGKPYIMRLWNVKGRESDNPFSVVEFQGAYRKGSHTPTEKPPRLKDLRDGDYYKFRSFDGNGGEEEQRAYQNDLCLCIGANPIRVTFFEINNVKSLEKSPEKRAVEHSEVKATQNAAPVDNNETNEDETSDQPELTEGQLQQLENLDEHPNIMDISEAPAENWKDAKQPNKGKKSASTSKSTPKTPEATGEKTNKPKRNRSKKKNPETTAPENLPEHNDTSDKENNDFPEEDGTEIE